MGLPIAIGAVLGAFLIFQVLDGLCVWLGKQDNPHLQRLPSYALIAFVVVSSIWLGVRIWTSI